MILRGIGGGKTDTVSLHQEKNQTKEGKRREGTDRDGTRRQDVQVVVF